MRINISDQSMASVPPAPAAISICALLEIANVPGERSLFRVQLTRHRVVGLRIEQFVELSCALDPFLESIVGLNPAFQLLDALDNRSCGLLVPPEAGVGHLLIETRLLLAQAREVKDASGAPRVARSTPPANGRVPIQPYSAISGCAKSRSPREGNGSCDEQRES
jgi:hypothetical protein